MNEPGSASARRMKLSVLIPVYNEERTIAEVIERVQRVPRRPQAVNEAQELSEQSA